MNLESPSLLLVGKPEGLDFRHNFLCNLVSQSMVVCAE
ncbi:hypothetical protein D047_1956 [Vibrio parahaemolyticus VPTS-2010_2]|nr:hypothetical protein D047_1956 [Vibrio parahaemolyticus VPTS-2010_2]